MTWETIERDWLGGQNIAPGREAVLEAFETVERLLGNAWLDSRRTGGLRGVGTLPTLSIVGMGRRLKSVEGCLRLDGLLNKIRNDDSKAASELTAMYLARQASVTLEIAPRVKVADRDKVPDFRLSAVEGRWVYFEVSSPDPSETHREVERILDRLSASLSAVPFGTAIDLVFLKQPSDIELLAIERHLLSPNLYLQPSASEYSDIAVVAVNQSLPGQIVPQDYGTPSVPRIGHARAEIVNGVAKRHISARIPFIDNRAKEFLTRESKQLPTDAPGVVMFDMANAATGVREWTSTILRRLQPKMHTRFSAVCLFHAGMQTTVYGEDWVPTSHLIVNPNARFPLDEWAINVSVRRTPPFTG